MNFQSQQARFHSSPSHAIICMKKGNLTLNTQRYFRRHNDNPIEQVQNKSCNMLLTLILLKSRQKISFRNESSTEHFRSKHSDKLISQCDLVEQLTGKEIRRINFVNFTFQHICTLCRAEKSTSK